MLVNISAGARELGVSIEHARRMIRTGKWPVYKLGIKATRLDVDEIRTLSRLAALARADGGKTAEGKSDKD